jgi:hypothetical protein
MQLQVECQGSQGSWQTCWICNRAFKIREARVIVCSDEGINYGEVCPQCVHQGFDWLSERFERLNCSRAQIGSLPNQRLNGQNSGVIGGMNGDGLRKHAKHQVQLH